MLNNYQEFRIYPSDKEPLAEMTFTYVCIFMNKDLNRIMFLLQNFIELQQFLHYTPVHDLIISPGLSPQAKVRVFL